MKNRNHLFRSLFLKANIFVTHLPQSRNLLRNRFETCVAKPGDDLLGWAHCRDGLGHCNFEMFSLKMAWCRVIRSMVSITLRSLSMDLLWATRSHGVLRVSQRRKNTRRSVNGRLALSKRWKIVKLKNRFLSIKRTKIGKRSNIFSPWLSPKTDKQRKNVSMMEWCFHDGPKTELCCTSMTFLFPI